MKDVSAAIHRFPLRELAIRRLQVADPDFRELCDDFAAATSALERWQADQDRAMEYREIIEEIATLIRQHLDDAERRGDHDVR